MKSERLGLLMIAASLLVILLIIGLFFDNQRTLNEAQTRSQGVSLARLLTQMPLRQLIPDDSRQGPLQVIRFTQDNPHFAYAAVTGPDNRVLAEVTASGVIRPTAPLSVEPVSWFGERRLALGSNQGLVQEFFAPVLSGGELAGHVRIGYAEPSLVQAGESLSFFAMLALPIFLLTPMFYYLMRREIRPLKQTNALISTMIQENPLRSVELKASGEMGQFIRNFNRVIEAAEGRIKALERDQTVMLASSKVIAYQKAKVESVLQSMPDGVLVMDEAGSATFANQKFESLANVLRPSVVGKRPEEWCKVPELLTFLSNYCGNTARKMEVGNLELETSGVCESRIAVNAYPLFSPKDESNIYGTLIVLRDTTADMLAKRARSEFVSHLSHELKTPLHVMGMYGEMLLGEEGSNEAFRIEAANIINDELERVGSLIKNMLNVSKIEMGSISLDRQQTKLRDLLDDIFRQLDRNAKSAGIDLKLELPSELSRVYVDKDLLRVAISNLLTNAIKYNRPGGTATLGADEGDDSVLIYVRDTGIGIDIEDQVHIFEKFYRSEEDAVREQSGHGLGLSLARDIVEIHNGELTVDSTLGEGSEFRIRLKKTPVLMRESA